MLFLLRMMVHTISLTPPKFRYQVRICHVYVSVPGQNLSCICVGTRLEFVMYMCLYQTRICHAYVSVPGQNLSCICVDFDSVSTFYLLRQWQWIVYGVFLFICLFVVIFSVLFFCLYPLSFAFLFFWGGGCFVCFIVWLGLFVFVYMVLFKFTIILFWCC